MKTLKISLDFLAGPLWKDEFIDGELRTGIPVIDNDKALQTLNDQICELYSLAGSARKVAHFGSWPSMER